MKPLQRLWRCSGREEGSVLVLTAVALTGLLGFFALTLDAGVFLWERRDLQNIADAAALAGTQELPQHPDRAIVIAREYAERNGAVQDGRQIEGIEVVDDDTAVRVHVAHPGRPTILGRVLGIFNVDIGTRAKGALRSPMEADNVLPWGLKDSARLSYGDVVTIKYSAQNVDTGNFGPLALPCGDRSTGASCYRDNIRNGSHVELNRAYQTEPGNMVGPTRQGLQWRLDNTSAACDSFDEVFESLGGGEWRFRSPQCNPWSGFGEASRRVALIPVIADTDFLGRSEVTVVSFALVFVEDFRCTGGNDCNVQVRFVRAHTDMNVLTGAYNPEVDVHLVRLVE